MANGKRDENRTVVLMGVSTTDGTTPIPLTVDSVTGRLRVYVAGTSLNIATPDRNTSRRDENRKPVLAGENAAINIYVPFSIEPFSIEPANDGLMLIGA